MHAGANRLLLRLGIPNYHNRQNRRRVAKVHGRKSADSQTNIANIFVFHGTVDLPDIKPPYIEAEISPDYLPEGFATMLADTSMIDIRANSKMVS